MNWVVMFDVPDGGDRRAVHRVLERRGYRVLHSVYELDAAPAGLDEALRACGDRVVGGHLLALPWCGSCRVRVLGSAREAAPDGLWAAW